MTYGGEHLAGADAVVEAHPAVEVGVLAWAEDVLVTHVVRLLIGHPVTAADTDGVAAVEVPEGVHAVAAALPVAPLEVAAFVEDYLEKERRRKRHVSLKSMFRYRLKGCGTYEWAVGDTALPRTSAVTCSWGRRVFKPLQSQLQCLTGAVCFS